MAQHLPYTAEVLVEEEQLKWNKNEEVYILEFDIPYILEMYFRQTEVFSVVILLLLGSRLDFITKCELALYLKLPWTHFPTMKWVHSVNLAVRLQIFGITPATPGSPE